MQKKKKNKLQAPVYSSLNPFKQQEKKYKLYLHCPTDWTGLVVVDGPSPSYDLVQIAGFTVALFNQPRGFAVVKQFYNEKEAFSLAGDCVFDFSRKYRTNEVQQKEKSRYSFFDSRVRWANIGQQYDWTARSYLPTSSEIPPPIRQFQERASTLVRLMRGDQFSYKVETVIVNFYGTKDYMTGHLDDAEPDQTSPIFSLSLGLSAVFLIGSASKEDRPLAVRLDSGDLAIMAGESRRSWHGVPRVIEESYRPPEWLPEQRDRQLAEYLCSNRINLNSRQAYV